MGRGFSSIIVSIWRYDLKKGEESWFLALLAVLLSLEIIFELFSQDFQHLLDFPFYLAW